MREILPALLGFVAIAASNGCGGRRAAVIAPATSAGTADVLERYQAHRLAPARVAPPTLSSRTFAFDDGVVRGRLTLVLAEDQPWNRWSDETARLFNNRGAHLFRLELAPVDARSLVRWAPSRTTLELNRAGDPLYAAPTQEPLLEELVFWAFQQERAILDGDLVDRTRAAGELRRAYLSRDIEPQLEGLIAFPIARPTPGTPDPSELHVVTMRVSLGLFVDEAFHAVSVLLD
jgi:hypothetical protein